MAYLSASKKVKKMNNIKLRSHTLFNILRIKSHEDFHNCLFDESINRYINHRKAKNASLGCVLAICANYREAECLSNFSFEKIHLSGIGIPDQNFLNLIDADSRMIYSEVNAECTDIPSKSFDLVLVKEGLHHLARPILGLYEMLRITNDASIVIEPADTFLGRIFEKIGLTNIYEINQENISKEKNNDGQAIRYRDNYVFRWTPKIFDEILKSYYLDSGYKIDITVGWMTSKWNGNRNTIVRILTTLVGRFLSFIPGSRGNYMSALITTGNDIPDDPLKL